MGGALLKQLGPTIFSNIEGHFFNHTLVEESDHLTNLMRVITKKYLSMRLKTYAKKYTEVVAHGNQPLSQHELRQFYFKISKSIICNYIIVDILIK